MRSVLSSIPGRVSVVCLFLLFSALISAQEEAIPKQIQDWQQAAAKAIQQKDYDAAAQIYGQIIQAYPQTRYAIEALRETAAAHIKAGQIEAAKNRVETLKTQYADHPDLAESLYWIARHYGWNNRWDDAMQLHRYNIAVNLSSEKAMWSQVEIVYDHIRRKDWAGAQTAQAHLMTQFSQQPTLAKEIWQISRAYADAGRSDTAWDMCCSCAAAFPETEYGAVAQGEIVVTRIKQRDFSAADAEYERLLVNFGKTPMLSREIYRIAGTYAQVGQADKSFRLYSINSQQNGDHDFGRWSGVEVTLSLIRQKNMEAAQEAWQAFAARYAKEPTLSKELYIFAREFYNAGFREIGFQIHLFNAERHGGTDHGRWSSIETVFYYIDEGDQDKAAAACLDFFQRYAKHPDLPMEIRNILNRYAAKGSLSAAKSMCATALMQLADNPAKIWVQHGMVLALLDQQAMQELDNVFGRMLAEYSDHKDLSQVVMSLGRYCRDTFNDTGLAIGFYNRYLNSFGGQPGAIDVTIELIGLYIQAGAKDMAATRISQLLNQYAEHPSLADKLIRLGNECRKQDYQAAINLYETALSLTSNENEQLSAYTGIAQCSIRLGDETRAHEIINTLFADYLNQSRIDYSLYVIGEEYYFMGYERISQRSLSLEIRRLFSNAKVIWERIITQLPETDHAAHSLYSIGMIHYHLEEYEDAISYYVGLIQKWPHYYKTPDAVKWCGRSYNELYKRNGLNIKEVEDAQYFVDALASQGQAHLMPDLCYAIGELRCLDERWEGAIKYLELYLEASKGDVRKPEAFLMLAQSEEQTGYKSRAISNYKNYLDRISPVNDEQCWTDVINRLEKLSVH